jgi:hypothetical protein
MITSPLANSLYSGGQTISFAGSRADPEDGTLAASKFEWSSPSTTTRTRTLSARRYPGVTSGCSSSRDR